MNDLPVIEEYAWASSVPRPRPCLIRLAQHIRSAGIAWTVRLMSWSDRLSYRDVSHPVGWRDHARWAIEGVLYQIFAYLYEGSDDELISVLHDEIPVKHMSPRQRAFYRYLLDRGYDPLTHYDPDPEDGR